MSWANQKEVLKAFRMLTEKEAFLRRLALACGAGLTVSIIAFIWPASARIPVFIFLLILYFIISDSLFILIVKRIKGLTSKKEQSYFRDDINNSGMDEPVFILNEPAEKDPGFKTWQKTAPISGLVKLISAVILSLISLHIIRKVYKPAFFIPAFILTSGAVYLICDYLLETIRRKDFIEFPTKTGDKLMLQFQRCFAGSKGYYFIGEVNNRRIGLPRMLRFLHTLIGGPTGEGKSSSLIILPLLFDADSRGSALAPDAKSPELFYWVAGRWIKKGKKVVLFDPWHPDCAGINPIPDADDHDLQAIIETIVTEKEEVLKEESFFRSRTRYLLYAILKLVQCWDEEYCNLPAVYRAAESVDILTELINNADPDVKRLFYDFNLLGEESKVNALTSIRDKMDMFMDENVRKAFSKNDFRLEMLFSEKDPCLLIIGAPIDKKRQGSRIASLIANLVTNMAFKERRLLKQAVQKKMRSFLPNDLYLYADELRNLKITQLPDLVSIAREIKMQVICSVTDLDLLKYYGSDFGSLMGNLRNKLFLGGLDHDSCEYISRALGKEEIITYGLVRDDALSRMERRLLMEPSEIHNLPKDKLIVFTSETRPFISNRVGIYECKWARDMHVPPPQEMRPYYEQWGFYSGPLADTELPKKGEYFDVKRLKGTKLSASIEKPLSLKDFEEQFEERGGGKYKRNKEQDEDTLEGNIKYSEEENNIVGIY